MNKQEGRKMCAEMLARIKKETDDWDDKIYNAHPIYVAKKLQYIRIDIKKTVHDVFNIHRITLDIMREIMKGYGFGFVEINASGDHLAVIFSYGSV